MRLIPAARVPVNRHSAAVITGSRRWRPPFAPATLAANSASRNQGCGLVWRLEGRRRLKVLQPRCNRRGEGKKGRRDEDLEQSQQRCHDVCVPMSLVLDGGSPTRTRAVFTLGRSRAVAPNTGIETHMSGVTPQGGRPSGSTVAPHICVPPPLGISTKRRRSGWAGEATHPDNRDKPPGAYPSRSPRKMCTRSNRSWRRRRPPEDRHRSIRSWGAFAA